MRPAVLSRWSSSPISELRQARAARSRATAAAALQPTPPPSSVRCASARPTARSRPRSSAPQPAAAAERSLCSSWRLRARLRVAKQRRLLSQRCLQPHPDLRRRRTSSGRYVRNRNGYCRCRRFLISQSFLCLPRACLGKRSLSKGRKTTDREWTAGVCRHRWCRQWRGAGAPRRTCTGSTRRTLGVETSILRHFIP